MQRSNIGAMLLTLMFFSCNREPASTVFQASLDEGYRVARQRYSGDIIFFVFDGSAACRQVRAEVFGTTPVGKFISTNFAVVEVAAGSAGAQELLARYRAPDGRPRIIIASDRLNNLRIQVVRLDRVNARRLLERLEAIKHAKTIADYLSVARRQEAMPPR